MNRNGFLQSFPAVLTGLLGLLVGAAGVGLFLAFAGDSDPLGAWAFGGVALVGVGGGLGLLVVVFHHRGGLLRSRVADAERRRYRRRHGRGVGNADSSRTKRV